MSAALDTARTGGCACGQVTFRTRGEPNRVALCHCMTCRKTSGSVLGAFAIFAADLVSAQGAVEGFRTSEECERCFCPRCGSSVFTRCDGEIEIGLGAFDEPNLFKPDYESWTIRREHWLATGGLKGFPTNRQGS
jgi:hypothetical protein